MKKVIALLSIIAITHVALAQSANRYLDSLYKELKNARTPERQFFLLNRIGDYYGYIGQPDSTSSAARQLLKIATKTNQDSMFAIAFGSIANYFGNTSDNKQALEYQFKALAFAEKSKNNKTIWLILKETGVTFKRLKDYHESLKYLKRADAYLKKISIGTNRTYTHMAEAFLGLGQPDSALRYIQLANEATKKEKDAYGYARLLYIFASVYQAKGDTDLAESYFKKCISFSEAETIYAPYITATTDYGQYLFDTKQYELAKEYALKGYKKASQSKNKALMINAAGLLRKVYYAIGEKDSSYFYSELKDAYTDSVFSEQQRSQIQNLSFSQQIKENEELLKKAEEEQQRKQNIQYALIALGIFTFLLLFFLLSRSIIVTEKWISFFGILGLLIVFEFINLLIHPFLERVTHHSPLLMLIALVALASLLIPLHHRMEKWIKEKMTEKNKRIRLENAKRTIEQLDGKTKGN